MDFSDRTMSSRLAWRYALRFSSTYVNVERNETSARAVILWNIWLPSYRHYYLDGDHLAHKSGIFRIFVVLFLETEYISLCGKEVSF